MPDNTGKNRERINFQKDIREILKADQKGQGISLRC